MGGLRCSSCLRGDVRGSGLAGRRDQTAPSNDLISKRLVYFAFSGPAPLLAPSYRQRFATPRSVNRLLQKITDLPAECAHVVCIWCRKVASGELVYHAKEPRPRSGAARM